MYILDDAIPGPAKQHEVICNGKAAVYVSEPGNAVHYACPVRLEKVDNWCSGKRSKAALDALREAGWVFELVPAVFGTGMKASEEKSVGLAVWPKTLCPDKQQARRRTTRAVLFGQSNTDF